MIEEVEEEEVEEDFYAICNLDLILISRHFRTILLQIHTQVNYQ